MAAESGVELELRAGSGAGSAPLLGASQSMINLSTLSYSFDQQGTRMEKNA
jgi:hypothetical protein